MSDNCPLCGGPLKAGTYTGPQGHVVEVKRQKFDAETVCYDCFEVHRWKRRHPKVWMEYRRKGKKVSPLLTRKQRLRK